VGVPTGLEPFISLMEVRWSQADADRAGVEDPRSTALHRQPFPIREL